MHGTNAHQTIKSRPLFDSLTKEYKYHTIEIPEWVLGNALFPLCVLSMFFFSTNTINGSNTTPLAEQTACAVMFSLQAPKRSLQQ